MTSGRAAGRGSAGPAWGAWEQTPPSQASGRAPANACLLLEGAGARGPGLARLAGAQALTRCQASLGCGSNPRLLKEPARPGSSEAVWPASRGGMGRSVTRASRPRDEEGSATRGRRPTGGRAQPRSLFLSNH